MKIRAFILPDGRVVSCHEDVFTQAGLEIEEVRRVSDVTWDSKASQWVARFLDGRFITGSLFRETCLREEKVVVEQVLYDWLQGHGCGGVDEETLITICRPKLKNSGTLPVSTEH